ncbi:exported hypothetical protein [Candidatus Sulfopaludibacter sp. SbA3]|nr:exported hypothetical protein [Candidatus Sulfopaludibacter sp. SbA3]
MNRSLTSLLLGGAVIHVAGAFVASAQLPKGYDTVIPLHNSVSAKSNPNSSQGNTVTPLPLWNFSVTAAVDLGGGTFTGTMVGRSPLSRGKTTTTIPTQIIPLVITITDGSGTVVYDPTLPDACNANRTTVSVIANSPIFTNNTWIMNGVNVGDTQYLDAFQRAEFWSLVGGSPYHLILQESTLGSQALSFGTGGTSGAGSNYNVPVLFGGGCGKPWRGGCEPIGCCCPGTDHRSAGCNGKRRHVPYLSNQGHGFLQRRHQSLRWQLLHSGLSQRVQRRTQYSDLLAVFTGYHRTLWRRCRHLSHDGRIVDRGNNSTHNWGNEGLSPGFGTPTNEFSVTQNGLTYQADRTKCHGFAWSLIPLIHL